MDFTIHIPSFLTAPFLFFVLTYRKLRYGYPFRRIKLTEGKFAIIDPEDYRVLNKLDWHLGTEFYACSNENIEGKRTLIRMHRKIMQVQTSLVVDHINQNRLDNRKANLRIATKAQNACNRKLRIHSSKFKGVSFHKQTNKWKAYINYSKKRMNLGTFQDEIEAAKAYDNAARIYHGNFASPNFPRIQQKNSSMPSIFAKYSQRYVVYAGKCLTNAVFSNSLNAKEFGKIIPAAKKKLKFGIANFLSKQFPLFCRQAYFSLIWRRRMLKTAQWMGVVISLLVIFILGSCTTASQTAAKDPSVKITDLGDKLKIELNGKFFADYVYKNCAQPHFYPIIGPTGEIMVRRWPVEEGKDGKYEQHDHPAHIGLWFGHMVNGKADFWGGGKLHEKFDEVSSGDIGIIKEQIKWTDGNSVATSTNIYKIYSNPQMLDYEITIHALDKPVIFNDSKEGTMAIRLATSMALNLDSKALGNPAFRFTREPNEPTGHIVNSNGDRDHKTLGKKAAWCDYYGPLNGQIVGVAIFDNPKNATYPTCWMSRDYGLFAANPFGISDINRQKLKKGQKPQNPENAGEYKIAPGENLNLKFRFYFHKGNEMEGKVADAYKQYVSESENVKK